MRVGFGYDIHRLVQGRKLVLGGVSIPNDRGEEGHSDGDALIHAIIDGLLGAAALGDIGTHFPPTDPSFKDIAGSLLLEKTNRLLQEHDFKIVNIDTTILLETPKLGEYKPLIQASLAHTLQIAIEKISVKAKTKEGQDSTGQKEAIEAYAVVLIQKG